MEGNSTTLQERLCALKPKHWALIAGGVMVILLIATSGGSGSLDPSSWNCENIKSSVISASQDHDLKILEINEVFNQYKDVDSLKCTAAAEWSEGYGSIEYGAHVSDGGSVIVEYRQQR